MVVTQMCVPDDWPDADVPKRLESLCRGAGLRLTLKGALQAYPGCVHWHFKSANAEQPGTLELTWWPSERRAWFKVARGRTAVWQPVVIKKLLGVLAA